MLIFLTTFFYPYFKEDPTNFIFSSYIFGVIIFLLKDIIKGKSIGKLIMKLSVINTIDKSTPSKLRLIIRNLFVLIAPVEVLSIFLGEDHERLGDKITGTSVYYDSFLK